MVYLLKVPDFEKVKKVSRWGQSWHNFRTKRAQLKKLATHNSYAVAEKNGDWSRGHTVTLGKEVQITWRNKGYVVVVTAGAPCGRLLNGVEGGRRSRRRFLRLLFLPFLVSLVPDLGGDEGGGHPLRLGLFRPLTWAWRALLTWTLTPEPWNKTPQVCSLTLLFIVHFHCSANN